ncbi:hypothetical protein [Carboxylicivirga sp. RSCT41]|uniref:hypothetical protein n=1 Tax=Carboxylicivirga agarovorans TaxID=3417570 RepID=UPI003D347CA6
MSADNFHNNYQALFEHMPHEAPDDVWKAIEGHLDNDAVHVRLDKDEDELVNEVWREMEDELDIDEVWHVISQELDAGQKRSIIPRFKYWLAAAGVLILLGLTNLMYHFSEQATQPLNGKARLDYKTDLSTDSNHENSNILIKPGMDSSVMQLQQPNELNVLKQHTTELLRNEPDAIVCTLRFPKEQSSVIAHSPMLASGSFLDPRSNKLLQSKTTSVEMKKPFDINIPLVLPAPDTKPMHWTDNFLTQPPVDDRQIVKYDQKDSRWTTGVVTALKNTYLLNAETYEGFSSTGMNNSKMTFQPDFGLTIQYAINTKFIFETNLFAASSLKQGYKTYSYGQYVNKETELNYYGAELAIKHNARYSLVGERLLRRNIGGVYINHLQSASETLSNTSSDVSSRYASVDYGLIIGQEFEIRSNGPVKVTTGLAVKYGLPNVYVGDDKHPAKLNKTHNASLEFRIGIAYRWKSKTGIDHYLGIINK